MAHKAIDSTHATFLALSNGMLNKLVEDQMNRGNLTVDVSMVKQSFYETLEANYMVQSLLTTSRFADPEQKLVQDILYAVLDRVNWTEVKIHVENRLGLEQMRRERQAETESSK